MVYGFYSIAFIQSCENYDASSDSAEKRLLVILHNKYISGHGYKFGYRNE